MWGRSSRSSKDAARSASPATPVGDVIDRFVRDGRLHSMPAQGPKRRLVLEYVGEYWRAGGWVDVLDALPERVGGES